MYPEVQVKNVGKKERKEERIEGEGNLLFGGGGVAVE